MICIKEHICSEMNFCVPVEKALRKVSQGQNPVIYQRNVFNKWQTFNFEFQYENVNTSFHIMFVTVCFQMTNHEMTSRRKHFIISLLLDKYHVWNIDIAI